MTLTSNKRIQKLDHLELEKQLANLSEWRIDQNELYRTFVFDSFADAISFMANATTEIEKMDHHPRWCNLYKKVDVFLSTHEAGGITDRDFSLARWLNQLFLS